MSSSPIDYKIISAGVCWVVTIIWVMEYKKRKGLLDWLNPVPLFFVFGTMVFLYFSPISSILGLGIAFIIAAVIGKR